MALNDTWREFDPDAENWGEWVEGLERYLEVNNIADDKSGGFPDGGKAQTLATLRDPIAPENMARNAW